MADYKKYHADRRGFFIKAIGIFFVSSPTRKE